MGSRGRLALSQIRPGDRGARDRGRVAAGAWLGALSARMYSIYFSFPFLRYRPGSRASPWRAWSWRRRPGSGRWGRCARAAFAARDRHRRAATQILRRPAVRADGPLPASAPDVADDAAPRRQLADPVGADGAGARVQCRAPRRLALFLRRDRGGHVAEHFDGSGRQDATVTLVEARTEKAIADLRHLPGVVAIEPLRAVAARLRLGLRSQRVAITGLDPGGTMRQVPGFAGGTLVMPEDGIVLSVASQINWARGGGDRLRSSSWKAGAMSARSPWPPCRAIFSAARSISAAPRSTG